MNFNMNESLGFILNKTAYASKNTFNHAIKEYDLSPEQWSVLYRVIEKPGISQKNVSDTTYKDQGNLTRMIEKLVKNNFIIKKQNNTNKREIQLFPTNKAIEVSEEISSISSKHNEKMLENFSQEEKVQIRNLLEKIYINLDKKD